MGARLGRARLSPRTVAIGWLLLVVGAWWGASSIAPPGLPRGRVTTGVDARAGRPKAGHAASHVAVPGRLEARQARTGDHDEARGKRIDWAATEKTHRERAPVQGQLGVGALSEPVAGPLVRGDQHWRGVSRSGRRSRARRRYPSEGSRRHESIVTVRGVRPVGGPPSLWEGPPRAPPRTLPLPDGAPRPSSRQLSATVPRSASRLGLRRVPVRRSRRSFCTVPTLAPTPAAMRRRLQPSARSVATCSALCSLVSPGLSRGGSAAGALIN